MHTPSEQGASKKGKTMSNYTQGTWRYEFVDGYCGELISSAGEVVATFLDEPSDEDAKLIAAAPELLEALKEIFRELAWDQLPPHKRSLAENASAAIAKATGK